VDGPRLGRDLYGIDPAVDWRVHLRGKSGVRSKSVARKTRHAAARIFANATAGKLAARFPTSRSHHWQNGLRGPEMSPVEFWVNRPRQILASAFAAAQVARMVAFRGWPFRASQESRTLGITSQPIEAHSTVLVCRRRSAPSSRHFVRRGAATTAQIRRNPVPNRP